MDHLPGGIPSKKLSDYNRVNEIRLKAELVADLMAEWIKKPEPDYHRLNQLSFQAFLWLPKNLADDVSDTLARKSHEYKVRSIIMKVRKHLLKNSDEFEENRVIFLKKRINENYCFVVCYALNC